METIEPVVIRGIVRGGVVVPDGGDGLPEGARVGIVLAGVPESGELAAETAAWERLSDDAWAMIAEWERE